MTSTTAKPLTEQTPVEIDTVLSDLYDEGLRLAYTAMQAADMVMHYSSAERQFGRGRGDWNMPFAEALAELRDGSNLQPWDREGAERAVLRYVVADQAVQANKGVQAPLHAEFHRRGGWQRVYIVKNADGHAHRGMDCSTCNRGRDRTAFFWMPTYSGLTEAEIVADAGWRACTVCYPSAPVGDEKSLPTKMFTQDDTDRAAAKTARDQAKADRLAAKIAKGLTADGSEFVVSWPEPSNVWRRDPKTGERGYVFDPDHVGRERFKTEQAATQWVVSDYADNVNGWGGKRFAQHAPAHLAIMEAIAAKHQVTLDEVKGQIAKKAAAKAKRDAR